MSTSDDADTVRVTQAAHHDPVGEAVTPLAIRAPTGHPVRPRTAAYEDANPGWPQRPVARIPSSDRLDDPFFQTTQPPPSAHDEDLVKVPRKRGGHLVLITLTVMLAAAAGAAAGGWKNRARLRAARAIDPASQEIQPDRASSSAAPPVLMPAPVPPVAVPAIPQPPPRQGARSGGETVNPVDRAAASGSAGRAADELPEGQSVRSRRGRPLRNMVWSDRLQKLAPAYDAPAPPPPLSDPEAPLPAPPP
jgi:hypothetical protein